jgi:diamine N-acetyltransferase
MIEKMTPFIRRATPEDASLLAELGARTFHDAFAADIKPEDIASYLTATFGPAKQAAELADPHATFLIAESAGVARGYAQLRAGEAPPCVTDSKPIELVRIYVSREWLGRGVGEALMRACLEEAQRAGHDTLWLGVWEHNGRAQAFYRKWGFRKVGEHPFQLGSEAQIDHVMERRL